MKKISTGIFLCLAALTAANAQIQLPEPGPALDAWTYEQYDYARQQEFQRSHEVQLLSAMQDSGTMEAYVEAKRAAYISKVIGPLPERTPLKARTAKKFKEDGYSVESVVFQSIPGRYVTGLLFLPQGASRRHKVPAVLLTCGHTSKGKLKYAPTGMALAKNGIACFVVEPFSQGERMQILDSNGEWLVAGSSPEHSFLCHSSLLTGRPLATRIFWDNSRAVDYLCKRREIDSGRLGVAGHSGAGVETMICAALEDRIKAVCVSHSAPYGETNTGTDGCAVLPYLEREGITLEDVCLMAAPKPFLFMGGKRDFVKEGLAARAIGNVRGGYAALGKGGSVEHFLTPDWHDYYNPSEPCPQDRQVQFFRKQFLGSEDAVILFDQAWKNAFEGEKYLCTATGQVLSSFKDAKSVVEENLELFDSYAAQREAFMDYGKEAAQAKVKELIGYEAPKGKIVTEQTVCAKYPGYSFKAFRLLREGQVPIACALVVPDTLSNGAGINICLYEEGKNAILRSSRQMEALLKSGKAILLADIRGFGETRAPFFDSSLIKRELDVNGGVDAMISWNRDMHLALSGIWTGWTMIAQRVADIQTLLDWCGEQMPQRDVEMTANKHAVAPAVHAAFLDDRIKMLQVSEMNPRWRLYIADPCQLDWAQDCVPGAVQFYDLKDLIGNSENIKNGFGM